MVNVSILKKIRCRFLDRATGVPVPGVVASLSGATGDETNSIRFPVGTLSTDATGYMSFDLMPLMALNLTTVSGLFISAPQYGLTNYDLLGSLVEPPRATAGNKDVDVNAPTASPTVGEMMMAVATMNGEKKQPPCIVFPIYLGKQLRDEQKSESPSCMPTRFPSIQSPDMCDYKVSPFSFVTPAAIKLGNDCCEILLPSSLPIQQHRFYKVIIRQESVTNADGTEVPIADTSLSRRVKVFDTLESTLKSQTPVIKFGEILEYRQDWYSLGHSLGEIKYSLPLAPGESTQLAVIDWSRDDLASRTDQIRATEFLDHDLRRDRAIEDTVDAALKEEQGGNSHFGGTSGTASGQTYGSGMWTGNHAFGGGISYSYGKRNLEADSLQDIHDRVRQASSSVRSLNSTVIVQASQTEKSTLQTRRVANHNHCHAITIQYYEVLRHYRMSTEYTGRRNAVLVPFEPFSFNGQDDWQRALRFRTVLEQTLLDPSLGDCFEALIRLNLVPTIYDVPQNTNDVPQDTTKPEITILKKSVKVYGSKGMGMKSGVIVKKDDKCKMQASGLLSMSSGGGIGSSGYGPAGNPAKEIATFDDFLLKGAIGYSLLYKIDEIDTWRSFTEGSPNLTAHKDGEIIFGVNKRANEFGDFGSDTPPNNNLYWTVDLEYPSHDTVPPTPKDPSKDDGTKELPFKKSDDELCSARLLNHLQNNQGYYNSAVWLLMDAVERRLYLENSLQGRPDILNGMDDKPLAISGNYVAFPYNGPLARWEDSSDEIPAAAIEDIVTLPTRGLFAEAQMGHCNSCEKRDVTRMWDWTEMTAETPPDISGISPGPKGTAPSITPGQLPGNVIQITTPQAAPDPAGLANALNVLKTPDIFRDMAGLDDVSKLLGDMVKDATDANIKAMGTQAQVKIAEMQAAARKNAGTGDQTIRPTATQTYDNLSAAKEIAKSADELGWSPNTTAAVTKDVVGGGGGWLSDIKKMIQDEILGASPTDAGALDSELSATNAKLQLLSLILQTDPANFGTCSMKAITKMRDLIDAGQLLASGVVGGALIAWIPKDMEDLVIGPAHLTHGLSDLVEATAAIPKITRDRLKLVAELTYLTCSGLTMEEKNYWQNLARLLV